MFKGNASVRFTVSKPEDAIYKETEQTLDVLGRATVSSSGTISISEGKLSGFGYKAEFDGKIVERDGTYTVYLDFQAKPGIIAWIISIFLFPFGLAVLILPYNAKGDIQRKVERAMDELKDAYDKATVALTGLPTGGDIQRKAERAMDELKDAY